MSSLKIIGLLHLLKFLGLSEKDHNLPTVFNDHPPCSRCAVEEKMFIVSRSRSANAYCKKKLFWIAQIPFQEHYYHNLLQLQWKIDYDSEFNF